MSVMSLGANYITRVIGIDSIIGRSKSVARGFIRYKHEPVGPVLGQEMERRSVDIGFVGIKKLFGYGRHDISSIMYHTCLNILVQNRIILINFTVTNI